MNGFLAKYDRAVELLGTESDAVLIVPPFDDLYRPSLGVHLLPAEHGISQVQPAPGYSWTFPSSADVQRLACHFVGEYSCAHANQPELSMSLDHAYREWRDCWRANVAPPTLSLAPVDDSHYLLMDTRGLKDLQMVQFLTEDQARTVLIGGPLHRQPLARWAIERKLAAALDGWCVPLAIADVDTWHRFESRISQASGATLSFAA